MDRSSWMRTLPAIAALVASTAKADAINPWAGASATAQVFVPDSSAITRSGTTAEAADGRTQTVDYANSRTGQHFSLNVGGSARAQATGQADGLLRLRTGFYSPNPGSSPERYGDPIPVSASASWSGDRAIVASAGGDLAPSMIRLNFSLGFVTSKDNVSGTYGSYPYGNPMNAVQITANGLVASLDGRDKGGSSFDTGHTFEFNPGTLGFDSTRSSQVVPDRAGIPVADGRFGVTFHVDLLVDASGLSDPFSVGVAASSVTGLWSNRSFNSAIEDLELSLTSVTTTDGRLLSDLGYDITFASGMLAPGVEAVPEPSSLAVCGTLVIAGAVGSVRHRRRTAAGRRNV